MNRIYRLVWNRGRQQWDVAAEITRARGKSGQTLDRAREQAGPLCLSSVRLGGATWVMAAILACTASNVSWASTTPPGQGGSGQQAMGGNSGNGGQDGAATGGGTGSNGNGGTGADGGSGVAGGNLVSTQTTASMSVSSVIASNSSNGTSGGTESGGNGEGGGGGGAGLLVEPSNAQLTVSATGQITGGNGGSGGNASTQQGGGGGGGGDGVIFTSGGTLTNAGQIIGGDGGAGGNNVSPNPGGGGGGGGGAGVSGAGLTIYNSGTIEGGAGGAGGSNGGVSGSAGTQGASVQFTGGANTLVMESGSQIDGSIWVMSGATATIQANASNLSINGGSEVDGNATFDTQGYTLTVDGAVLGNGVLTKIGSGTLVLAGSGDGSGVTVSDGTLQLGNGTTSPGFNGVMTMSSGTALAVLVNTSLNGTAGTNVPDYIAAGGSYAGTQGGTGNAAVSGTSFTVTNSGSITGGMGGTGGGSDSDNLTLAGGEGGDGAAGITGTSFTVANSGLISGGIGGTGGTAEGDNNILQPGSNPPSTDTGGTGGVAINGSGFSITNSGRIVGGTGGTGGGVNGDDNSGMGGAGGTGGAAIQGSSFTLVNNGTVTGGKGGTGGSQFGLGNTPFTNGATGNGSVAIVATGNANITDGGTISGGSGTSGQQDAIDFSGGGNTLTLESGYTIVGNVISTSTGAGDTLALGGSGESSFNVAQIVASNPGSYGSSPVFAGFTNFLKSGGSTWTLTGTTGVATDWVIEQGTLAISSDNNLGAGNQVELNGGTLENTATITTARNITLGSSGGTLQTDALLTVLGTINGNGELIKTGVGSLSLTANNTNSGGIDIMQGVLTVTSDANLGASSGGITLNGGTLDISGTSYTTTSRNIALGANGGDIDIDTASNSFTVTHAITGSGSLDKLGNGTLLLTAANTYTGGTTISAGVLQGDANSLQGNIVNNAELVFDQASNGTYAGNISGSGTLTKAGNSTLVLTGTNTYTGGTEISAGTLQASTASLQGNVANSGVLVFNQASDGTYTGVIAGTGSVTKISTGTLILDGANTYTGSTTISAGTLEVGDSRNASTASIAGAVDVQSQGTLDGYGTIGGNVMNDGAVLPGDGVGTLTIHGNYTQNADGTLQIAVTPQQASMLQVSGTASLAGTLNLIYAPGTYATATLPLVQASSVSGTFGTVNANGSVPNASSPHVTYTSTAADLILTASTTTTTGGNPPPPVLIAPKDEAVYANLMQSVNLVNQQTLSSVLDIALASNETHCDNTEQPRMQNVTTQACGSSVWAQYTGSSLSTNPSGLNSTGFGLLGGADHAFGDAFHLGVEAGVDRNNGSDTYGSNGDVDSAHLGIYSYADVGPVVFSGTVDGMHSSYRVNRVTGIAQATSSPDGNTLSAALQAAWPLQLEQWQLTPKAGALYQHQVLNGFNETIVSGSSLAADFAVTGAHSDDTSVQPFAGVSLMRSFQAQGVTYVPQLSLGYRYDTHNDAAPIVQVTTEDGTVFDAPAAARTRGMGTAGARITAIAGATWNLYLDYQGLFANHLRDNALSAGFTKRF